MTWANLSLLPATPEIFLLLAVSVILVLDLFVSDENRDITFGLTLGSLAITALLTIKGFSLSIRPAFYGLFVADAMSDVLKVAMYVVMALILVFGRRYAIQNKLFRGEWMSLSLFALLGMMVMASAVNFLTLYVGLELLSLSLYALVALQRESVKSTEAAMKYFVLGALASGMLLYGMSMIYGATGTLDIGLMAQKIAAGQANHTLLVFGLVFLVTGIGFKLGAVPFHMWVPDVYQGAPTVVTLLIGSAPKLAAFAFVIRILVQGLGGLFADWQYMLVILAVLSMGIGNVVAIAQTNIKRMLAYSTISHMGFLLLGIIAGSKDGFAASMFYAVIYAIMATASFGIVMLLSRDGFEAERLSDFKGLAKRNPWFAWMMLFVMFSMAGIPVFVGFFAKLAVLKAIVQSGLVWLAVVAVAFSLVGAFYYLRVVKIMFFDEPETDHELESTTGVKVLLSLNALILLIFGLAPDRLLNLMTEVVKASVQIL